MDPADGFFLEAFHHLSTCREVGMGFGPIPWRDIILYADRKGLEPDVHELFVTVIRAMDDAWLNWQGEEQRKRQRQEQLKAESRGK